MKVDIQITPDALVFTSATLGAVYNSKALTKRERSTLSIAFDVAALFEKKVSYYSQNRSKLRKTIKITLKYHEAYMLELLLIEQISTIKLQDVRIVIQGVIDKINQKLA